MTRAERAMELHQNGYNCAQSVIAAFSDLTGMDDQTCKALSVGFGAGMGRLQRTCGAVSGGIMVIGAMNFDDADVTTSKNTSYQKVRELMEHFESIHGSSECLRLVGVDIRQDELNLYARDHGIFARVCMACIKDTCEYLDRTLLPQTEA